MDNIRKLDQLISLAKQEVDEKIMLSRDVFNLIPIRDKSKIPAINMG